MSIETLRIVSTMNGKFYPMNSWQIGLMIGGAVGCGWALMSIASLPRHDPSQLLYVGAFMGFFGLIYLGVRHREN